MWCMALCFSGFNVAIVEVKILEEREHHCSSEPSYFVQGRGQATIDYLNQTKERGWGGGC